MGGMLNRTAVVELLFKPGKQEFNKTNSHIFKTKILSLREIKCLGQFLQSGRQPEFISHVS